MLVFSKVDAANVFLTDVPTSWRLQNYVGDNVATWFTGSAYTNGRLTLDANASMEDKNRYWATLMATKLANKSVVVYYEDSVAPDHCLITSYFLKEE